MGNKKPFLSWLTWLTLVISFNALVAQDAKYKNYRRINLVSKNESNCFCFQQKPYDTLVPAQLDPHGHGLKRLIVYLYEDLITAELKAYIPSKDKQGMLPNLPFEAGDGLRSLQDQEVDDFYYDFISHAVSPVNKSDKMKKETPNNASPDQKYNEVINNKPLGVNTGNIETVTNKVLLHDFDDNDPNDYDTNRDLHHELTNNFEVHLPDHKKYPGHFNVDPFNVYDNKDKQVPLPLFTHSIFHHNYTQSIPNVASHSKKQKSNIETELNNVLENSPTQDTGEHNWNTIAGDENPTIIDINAQINNSADTKFDYQTEKQEPVSKKDVLVPESLISNDVAENNAYLTFDKWFDEQMKRVKKSRAFKSNDMNIETLKSLIETTLDQNGMSVSTDGVLTDSSGKVLDLVNLKLRPILIGNSVAYASLIKKSGAKFIIPSDTEYLESILISLVFPPKILGIIPLGKVQIPKAQSNIRGHHNTSTRWYAKTGVPARRKTVETNLMRRYNFLSPVTNIVESLSPTIIPTLLKDFLDLLTNNSDSDTEDSEEIEESTRRRQNSLQTILNLSPKLLNQFSAQLAAHATPEILKIIGDPNQLQFLSKFLSSLTTPKETNISNQKKGYKISKPVDDAIGTSNTRKFSMSFLFNLLSKFLLPMRRSGFRRPMSRRTGSDQYLGNLPYVLESPDSKPFTPQYQISGSPVSYRPIYNRRSGSDLNIEETPYDPNSVHYRIIGGSAATGSGPPIASKGRSASGNEIEFSDDDLQFRIIGGSPATGSGFPVTSKGRSGFESAEEFPLNFAPDLLHFRVIGSPATDDNEASNYGSGLIR